jgi:hypothetical protein
MKRITARIADRLNSVGEAAYRIVQSPASLRIMGCFYAVAVCVGYLICYGVFQRCAECQRFGEFVASIYPLVERMISNSPEFAWTGLYVALLWMLFLPFNLTFPLAVLLVSQHKRSWGPQNVSRDTIPKELGGVLFLWGLAAYFFFVPDHMWGYTEQSRGVRHWFTSDVDAIWFLPALICLFSIWLAVAFCWLVMLFQAVLDLFIRGRKDG